MSRTHLKVTAAGAYLILASMFTIWQIRKIYGVDPYVAATAHAVERSYKETGIFVIHRPDIGCPSFWEVMPRYFSEQDGTLEDACYFVNDQNGPTHWDYLKGGEGAPMSTGIEISLPRKDKL